MEQWLPKGGATSSPDGAFERFLTAAIATIITIMFSWRLLDKTSGEEEDEHEPGRRHQLGYSSPSSLSSSFVSFSSPLREEPGVNSPLNPRQRSGDTSGQSLHAQTAPRAPLLVDQKPSSRVTSSNVNAHLTNVKPASRVPVDLPLCGDDPGNIDYIHATTGLKTTGARPTSDTHKKYHSLSDRLDTRSHSVGASHSSYQAEAGGEHAQDTHSFISTATHNMNERSTYDREPQDEFSDSSLEDVEFIGVEGNSDLFLNISSDSGDGREEYRHIINNDNYRQFRVTDNRHHLDDDRGNDYYDFEDGSAEPRELYSGEQLFCCSVLEPITEEDSDDMSGSSQEGSSRSDNRKDDFRNREVEYDLEYEEKKRGVFPSGSQLTERPIYNVKSSSLRPSTISGMSPTLNRTSGAGHAQSTAPHFISRLPDLENQGARLPVVNSRLATRPDYTITGSEVSSGSVSQDDSPWSFNVLNNRQYGVSSNVIHSQDYYEHIRFHGSSVDRLSPTLFTLSTSNENLCNDSDDKEVYLTGEVRNVKSWEDKSVPANGERDQVVPRSVVKSLTARTEDTNFDSSKAVVINVIPDSSKVSDSSVVSGLDLTSGLRPVPVTTKRPVSDGFVYACKRQKSEDEGEAAFFRDRVVSEGGGVAFGEGRSREETYEDIEPQEGNTCLDGVPDPNLLADKYQSRSNVGAGSLTLSDSDTLHPKHSGSVSASSSSSTSHDLNLGSVRVDQNLNRSLTESEGNREGAYKRTLTPVSDVADKLDPNSASPILLKKKPTDLRLMNSQLPRSKSLLDKMDGREYYPSDISDRGSERNSVGGRRETDDEETEYEEEIVETFVLPVSQERTILRTLQSVKDLLDQRSAGSKSALIPRNEEDEVDDAAVSSCVSSMIDVEGHDELGFKGNDDVTSGYRGRYDAVVRTDRDLKEKLGFELNLDEFKTDDYNTESGWPIVRYIEKERFYVDDNGVDEHEYVREMDWNRNIRELYPSDGHGSGEMDVDEGEEFGRRYIRHDDDVEWEERRFEEDEDVKRNRGMREVYIHYDMSDGQHEGRQMDALEEEDEDQQSKVVTEDEVTQEGDYDGRGHDKWEEEVEEQKDIHVTGVQYMPVDPKPVKAIRLPVSNSRDHPLYQRTNSNDQFAKLEQGNVMSPTITLPSSPVVKVQDLSQNRVKSSQAQIIPTKSNLFSSASYATRDRYTDRTSLNDFSSFASDLGPGVDQITVKYEDFVREMAHMEKIQPTQGLEESYPSLTPNVDSAILSGNLATPFSKQDVFVFPKQEPASTSDHTSPVPKDAGKVKVSDSEVKGGKRSEEVEKSSEDKTPVKKPRLVRTSTAQDEEELLGFKSGVRRSSSGSLFDGSVGVLNRSFEETSSNSFALDRQESEPGELTRNRSSELLSRSRSREAMLLESPTVEFRHFPESPRKAYSQQLFVEPTLDVVLESTSVANEEHRTGSSSTDSAPTTPVSPQTKESLTRTSTTPVSPQTRESPTRIPTTPQKKLIPSTTPLSPQTKQSPTRTPTTPVSPQTKLSSKTTPTTPVSPQTKESPVIWTRVVPGSNFVEEKRQVSPKQSPPHTDIQKDTVDSGKTKMPDSDKVNLEDLIDLDFADADVVTEDVSTPTKVIPPTTPTKVTTPITLTKATPTTTPTKVVLPTTPTKVVPPTTPTKVVPSTTPTKVVPPTTPAKVVPPTTSTKVVSPTTPTTVVTPTTPTKVVTPTTPTKVVPSTIPTKVVPTTTSPKVVSSTIPTTVVPTTTPTKVIPPTTQANVMSPTTPTKLPSTTLQTKVQPPTTPTQVLPSIPPSKPAPPTKTPQILPSTIQLQDLSSKTSSQVLPPDIPPNTNQTLSRADLNQPKPTLAPKPRKSLSSSSSLSTPAASATDKAATTPGDQQSLTSTAPPKTLPASTPAKAIPASNLQQSQSSSQPTPPKSTPASNPQQQSSQPTPPKSTPASNPQQPSSRPSPPKSTPVSNLQQPSSQPTPPKSTPASNLNQTSTPVNKPPVTPTPIKPPLAPRPRTSTSTSVVVESLSSTEPERLSPTFGTDRVERKIEIVSPAFLRWDLINRVKIHDRMDTDDGGIDVRDGKIDTDSGEDGKEREEESVEEEDSSSELEEDDEEEEEEEKEDEGLKEEPKRVEFEGLKEEPKRVEFEGLKEEPKRVEFEISEKHDLQVEASDDRANRTSHTHTVESLERDNMFREEWAALSAVSSDSTPSQESSKISKPSVPPVDTTWAHSQFIPGSPKKHRSMREVKKLSKQPYKSVLTQEPPSPTSPKIKPFVLPESLLTPSRLKIIQSRNKFLNQQNMINDPFIGEFEAHKKAMAQATAPAKDRKYTPKMSKHPNYRSQEQLEKIMYMINLKHGRSEGSLHTAHDLHDDCILSDKGRREMIDKALSMDNIHMDLYRQLQRFDSETDTDGGPLSDAYFPETNSDLFDLTFPFQSDGGRYLGRPASMSELRHASDYTTISGHGSDYFETPGSKGKGRFSQRQYKKSKSLCTLETNLDDVNYATSTTEDGLQRVPSAHELRISKSLQKLNVPNWYKQSSLSKSGSCLLKYGSSSSMSSWAFSPSLISSPCTTPSATSNVVIRSRVQLPTSRNLRSPRFTSKSAPSTPSFLNQSQEETPSTPTPVKLPSEKMRTKDKPKSLMPIPIVPFDKIRAMFEKNKEGDSQKPRKEESPASPITPPPSSTKTQSAPRPTLISPTTAFAVNGDEVDYGGGDIMPKVIVSPTDPNVKSILKRPTQEKRYSDIQEAPEADDEPVIVRPVPTRPPEPAATITLPQTPTLIIPTQPIKQQQSPAKPQIKEKPEIKPKPVPPERKKSVELKSSQTVKDEPKPSPITKQEQAPQKKTKEQEVTSPISKSKGFAFFKSLRSSSSSSNEDVKEKGRKSPREKGQKPVTSPARSPDSSYDAPDAFPASPASRLSPPTITVTPDISKPKGPAYVNVVADKREEPATVSRSAPVQKPSTAQAKEETIKRDSQTASYTEPSKQDTSRNTRSREPVQETNLDDSFEPELVPEPAPPLSKPEKKRSWFPKSRSPSSKSPEEPSKITTKPKVAELQSKFEIQQLSDEPRRLRSPVGSESSRSGYSQREQDRSRTSNLSEDSRSAPRESDPDRSYDSYSSRSADRSRESERDYPRDTRHPERKPSIESDRSLTRGYDRPTPRDIDRSSDRDSDRRSPLEDRSRSSDSYRDGRYSSSEDDRRGGSRDRDSDRDYDRLDSRDYDRRDYDRLRDYDRRDRDYDRDRDYYRREPDYEHRDRDYHARDRTDRERDRRDPPARRDRDWSSRDESDYSRESESENENRRGRDLGRGSQSRDSGRDSDKPRDTRIRRPSDNYEDTSTSRTSISSGRTWQPKPRGSRGSDSSPPKRVGSSAEESFRTSKQSLDSNGTSGNASTPYKYRVAGSAFSASKPNAASGLNTPPSERHEISPSTKADSSSAAAAKSLRETTV